MYFLCLLLCMSGSRVVCLNRRLVLHQWVLYVCVCLCVFVGTSSAAEESRAGEVRGCSAAGVAAGERLLGDDSERKCD